MMDIEMEDEDEGQPPPPPKVQIILLINCPEEYVRFPSVLMLHQ